MIDFENNDICVVSNGTHRTAVELTGDGNPQEEAISAARAKFQAAGLSFESIRVVATVNPDDIDADDIGSLGLTESMVIEAAKDQMSREHDPDIDEDAEISGFNVQCWAYIDPSSCIQFAVDNPPVAEERTAPDRRTAAVAPFTRKLDTLKHEDDVQSVDSLLDLADQFIWEWEQSDDEEHLNDRSPELQKTKKDWSQWRTRILACVKACSGVPTATLLESGGA